MADLTVGTDSYDALNDNDKTKDVRNGIISDSSKKLYATLLSSTGKIDGNDVKVSDALNLNGNEKNIQRFLFFVEYLNLKGKSAQGICDALTNDYLKEIQNYQGNKVDKLMNILYIQLGIADNEKKEINHQIKAKQNLIVNKETVDEVSLKKIEGRRIRHFAQKINEKFKESNGDYSQCCKDILRLACQINIGQEKQKFMSKVDVKLCPFTFRNIHKIKEQTQKTKSFLKNKLDSSANSLEQNALGNLINHINKAYNAYVKDIKTLK